jgi:hypothetical protein
MQIPNYFSCPFGFVDVSEDSITTNDVIMPSNSPVAPIKGKELEEASLNMNVSKDRTKKNGLKKWCTPESIIEHGIVDCLLTHVPYQFTFKKFLIMELCQKGLKNVSVKMTMFIFTIEF